jgi:predicted dehydrogenase
MTYRPLINIGIVGCGRVAQHYKGIFGRGIVKNYLISAVCDIEPEKANRLGSELNAKTFYSLQPFQGDSKFWCRCSRRKTCCNVSCRN